jgi:hypothetical protein
MSAYHWSRRTYTLVHQNTLLSSRAHTALITQDYFEEALDFVKNIDFSDSQTDQTVRSVNTLCS